MVLPFENTSNTSDFNWVGESIADSLTDLLKDQRLSLNVISNQERKIIQRRLKMPTTNLPSLATSLKLAREGKATLLVSGKYNVIPEKGDTAASITINAKIIRVNEGQFLSEEFNDGSRKIREITLTDAMGNLQSVHGQTAYNFLFLLFGNTLTVSNNEMIEKANKVPARAFEAYIKGLLSPVNDKKETRANFFKNAILIYANERSNELYTDAALELGHLYLNRKEYDNAIAYFSQIPQTDAYYAEAAFYSGLIYWGRENYEQALAVLNPLADELQLTDVYNTLGAIAVEASRKTKKDVKKSAKYLTDGIGFLNKAAESAEKDTNPNFNLGFAYFLLKDYKDAADSLRPVLASNPRDGEAYFLIAKSLEQLNDSTAADFDNQARRFLTVNNKYAKLESNWKRGTIDDIDLRVVQPTRREFVSTVLIKEKTALTVQQPLNETQALLKNAEQFYEAGQDDQAMTVLNRVIVQEPMSAKSYLLKGKIYFRRGELESAESNLKTSLFWNNQLIDAHILLGRIYLQKGDCLQSRNYVASALRIDSNNPDAAGLERQVERCSK
jgi:tetratricopeptide (TPR) repeat protein